MTSKHLMEAIKRGETPETLANKQGIAVVDLEARIRRLYGKGLESKADDVIRKLRANRKKPHTTPTVPTAPQPQPQQFITEEEKDPLLALRAEEEELSAKVVLLEKEYETIRSTRHGLNKKLRELESLEDSLKEQLENCSKEYNKVSADLDQLGTQMNEITEKRRPLRARLDEIRQEIDGLITVTVTVSDDGTIEAPENPDVRLDDTGFEDLKKELLERTECQKLRVCDIEGLARLLKIQEHIGTERRINPICDSQSLEEAFLALQGQK